MDSVYHYCSDTHSSGFSDKLLDTDHRLRAYRLGGPLTATQLDVYLARLVLKECLSPLDATPTGVALPPLLQP